MSETESEEVKRWKDNKKLVFAEYRGTSQFEIPLDVKEYSVKWNKVEYTDKDGVEHEVEPLPFFNLEEDIEFFKHPKDVWCETDDAYQDEPLEEFYEYFEDMKKREVIEMLWNRMDYCERQEMYDEWRKEHPSEEEDEEEEEEKETLPLSGKTGSYCTLMD
jgi:hypothetical protein